MVTAKVWVKVMFDFLYIVVTMMTTKVWVKVMFDVLYIVVTMVMAKSVGKGYVLFLAYSCNHGDNKAVRTVC